MPSKDQDWLTNQIEKGPVFYQKRNLKITFLGQPISVFQSEIAWVRGRDSVGFVVPADLYSYVFAVFSVCKECPDAQWENECNNAGDCKDGVCYCDSGFEGYKCQVEREYILKYGQSFFILRLVYAGCEEYLFLRILKSFYRIV